MKLEMAQLKHKLTETQKNQSDAETALIGKEKHL
jgi:hypothetical protein